MAADCEPMADMNSGTQALFAPASAFGPMSQRSSGVALSPIEDFTETYQLIFR
jgi:hypothetical protein